MLPSPDSSSKALIPKPYTPDKGEVPSGNFSSPEQAFRTRHADQKGALNNNTLLPT